MTVYALQFALLIIVTITLGLGVVFGVILLKASIERYGFRRMTGRNLA